jgi:hypothetical protein
MQLISVVVIAIFIYLVQYNIYKKNWENGLSVRLFFTDEYVEIGEKSELVEVVNNAKPLPLPVFHVKLSLSKNLELNDRENVILSDAYHRNDAYSVMGNQKVTRTVGFTARKRGMYGINGVNITARDFFMTRNFARKIKNNEYIYVLPEKVACPSMDALMNMALGEIAAKRSLNEDMLLMNGIRRYEPNDSFRRINWRATARCDELMVNTYERAAEFKVQILLDLGDEHMNAFEDVTEFAVSLASTAVKLFTDKGIPVALASNGSDIITGECEDITYGSSYAHRIAVDKCLSRICKSEGEAAFKKLLSNKSNAANYDGNAVTYLVISTQCRQELVEVLDAMRSDNVSVYMLLPHMNTQKPKCERDYIYSVEVEIHDR